MKQNQADQDELVTIARFLTQPELDIARGFLQSEGIDSFAPEEHYMTSAGGIGLEVGGMRLQVRRSDVAQAAKLLHDIDKASSSSVDEGEPS